MRRHRTTARGIALSLLLAGLTAAVLASPSSGGPQAVPRLVFPLVAETALWDNYGDSRGTHSHAGIDMENPWRAPVVAVEAGKVEYADSGLGGCMLYLYGRSGTMYLYIHLNNDLTPKNDGKGGCKKDVTFAVPDGARVAAGQQVAWNGDSGDANGNPHLHFEVHPGGGADTNPFPHLKRAARPLFAAKLGAAFSLGLGGKLVAAGAGSVSLEVGRVRHYPGGAWLKVPSRSVELRVAPEADVPAKLLSDIAKIDVRGYKAALPVTAYTLRGKVTPDAIVGAPGALEVSRLAPTR